MTSTTRPTSDAENIIEAVGLTKTFGTGKQPVRPSPGSTSSPQPGQVTAVLGPNGAGKSTLVRAVATLLRPDAGPLPVAGIDAVRHPDQVRPDDRPRRAARRGRAGA